jgi:sec-independent protein translocase protein TatA
MPNLKPMELILILLVVLLLFGAKRLPDAARGLGRSLRIFKAEMKAAQDDDGNTPPQHIQAGPGEVSSTPPAPPAQQPAPPVQQPTPQPESPAADR